MTTFGFKIAGIRQLSLVLLIAMMIGFIAEFLSAEESSVVIIGNRDLPFDSISERELGDIFRQKTHVWKNNTKIHVVLLEGGKTHDLFLQTYFHEKQIQLSPRKSSSITFRHEKNLMKHIALTGGAIGYISNNIKPTNVKIIKITD